MLHDYRKQPFRVVLENSNCERSRKGSFLLSICKRFLKNTYEVHMFVFSKFTGCWRSFFRKSGLICIYFCRSSHSFCRELFSGSHFDGCFRLSKIVKVIIIIFKYSTATQFYNAEWKFQNSWHAVIFKCAIIIIFKWISKAFW